MFFFSFKVQAVMKIWGTFGLDGVVTPLPENLQNVSDFEIAAYFHLCWMALFFLHFIEGI